MFQGDTDVGNSLKAAKEAILRIVKNLSQEQVDKIVDKVALQSETNLKINTPKGWFGTVRNGWTTRKPEPGVRVVSNGIRTPNGVPIVLFLEEGTARAGTGWIYPRTSKKLYVPLTKRAAAGWRPSLVYGKDYVLKNRVRGIKPLHFIAAEREKIEGRIVAETKRTVEGILRQEGFIK